MTIASSAPPSGASTGITVFAPAKVNLVLRVLDRRPDGFHNLWSVMQTVGLEDEVALRLDGNRPGIRLQCTDPGLPADRTNLVFRAADAVLRRCRKEIGVDITLTKRIPIGAGLGGGSSDAAATIVGMSRLLQLGWTATEMAHIGQTLGSDVPFFFFAPTALVMGRGERVSPVRIVGHRWIVLVNPGFPIETKWAYQELAATRVERHALSDTQLSLSREPQFSWERVLGAIENDFESPVFRAYPLLEAIKRDLLALGAEAALLSGSGATVFGVFRDEERARRAIAEYPAEPQFKIFAAAAGSSPLRCHP